MDKLNSLEFEILDPDCFGLEIRGNWSSFRLEVSSTISSSSRTKESSLSLTK